VLLLLMTIEGCGVAGGGGTVHLPPKNVLAGQPTTLTMTFSVWGSGSGDLSKRYTNVTCQYRIDCGEFKTVSASVNSSDSKTMAVHFVMV
jgi:hypothetical protein